MEDFENNSEQTKSVYEIDETGYILGIIQVDGDSAGRYVEIPYQGGLYVPRWNGEEWVEGGVAPEPTPQEPTIEERLETTETKVATIEEIVEALYG